jgi:hypothetical protein
MTYVSKLEISIVRIALQVKEVVECMDHKDKDKDKLDCDS